MERRDGCGHAQSLQSTSDSLQPYELQPTSLLCPWDSPGKNARMGCCALLQGIFLTQGLNPHLLHLLHCRWILYRLSRQGYLLLMYLIFNLVLVFALFWRKKKLGVRSG